MSPTPVWIPIALGIVLLACDVPAWLRRRRSHRRAYQRQRQALERACRRAGVDPAELELFASLGATWVRVGSEIYPLDREAG